MDLSLFDCNAYIGRPGKPGIAKYAPDAAALLAEMDRAGIEKALVWHVDQRDTDPLIGNELLSSAIAGHDRLAACWSLLPNQCDELGDLDEFFSGAMKQGVRAVRMWPVDDRFLLRPEVIGDVMEHVVARRIPFIFSQGGGDPYWKELYELMKDFPELTVVIADTNAWGSDRFTRPLIETYPNVYLETSGFVVDGGIQAFVEKYGASRVLFGTRYPDCYQGAAMLTLVRADISDEDKQSIAAGNLERLLAEVKV